MRKRKRKKRSQAFQIALPFKAEQCLRMEPLDEYANEGVLGVIPCSEYERD